MTQGEFSPEQIGEAARSIARAFIEFGKRLRPIEQQISDNVRAFLENVATEHPELCGPDGALRDDWLEELERQKGIGSE